MNFVPLRVIYPSESLKLRKVKRRSNRKNRMFIHLILDISPDLPRSRPAQWVTLDGLLEKLLFLTVSADGEMINEYMFPSLTSLQTRPTSPTSCSHIADLRAHEMYSLLCKNECVNLMTRLVIQCFRASHKCGTFAFITSLFRSNAPLEYVICLNSGYRIIHMTFPFEGLQAHFLPS